MEKNIEHFMEIHANPEHLERGYIRILPDITPTTTKLKWKINWKQVVSKGVPLLHWCQNVAGKLG